MPICFIQDYVFIRSIQVIIAAIYYAIPGKYVRISGKATLHEHNAHIGQYYM